MSREGPTARGRSSFTIRPDLAFRDRRQHLLAFVQAAVLGGATCVAIDTRSDSLMVRWGGDVRPQLRDLEGLSTFLTSRSPDRLHRSLRCVALAVNDLLQRRPTALTLDNGSDDGGCQVTFDGAGQATPERPPGPTTGVGVTARFEVGWGSRLASLVRDDGTQLVEERCLYTPVPILLNNGAPFGFEGSRQIAVAGARAFESFDHGSRRGVIAISRRSEGLRGFRIVVGGVWIVELLLESLASVPLYGVICDDALQTTADGADIVRDWRFYAMLEAVQPTATELMRRSMSRSYRPPSLPSQHRTSISGAQLRAAPCALQVAWDAVSEGDAGGELSTSAFVEAAARAERLGLDWDDPVQRAIAERATDEDRVRSLLSIRTHRET